MRFRDKPATPVSLDITPLVDVVFTLVIFFMITTTFASVSGLKMDLPEAATTEQTPAQQQTTVTVDRDGRFYVQGEAVMVENLENRLLNAVKGDPNQWVVVQVDKNARFEPVVQVLDSARKLGLSHISMATHPLDENKVP